MALEILIGIAFLALALLPAFLGADTRDGRDSQPGPDRGSRHGAPHH